jgi:pyruvate dehydrogenase E1 component alpha subunit
MPNDIWSLYEWMYKSRLFEEATAQLWQEGRISGEMHLGTGEEAIVAGVMAHVREGDALALDHRSSPAWVMRGADLVQVLLEMLGHPKGLCGGKGGHMHLYSREFLAASVGIVGAGGPAAAGFALAAQALHPGSISVAFFGEGAFNQGMLMESIHLASLWGLPILFVCKNDGWQITMQSADLEGKDLIARAEALGVPGMDVDGGDVLAVQEAAGAAIERIRAGGGPVFLHARCIHLEGHFLGFQLLRIARNPVKEIVDIGGPLLSSVFSPTGAAFDERIAGLKTITKAVLSTWRDPRGDAALDPLTKARAALQSDPSRLKELESRVEEAVIKIFSTALAEVES